MTELRSRRHTAFRWLVLLSIGGSTIVATTLRYLWAPDDVAAIDILTSISVWYLCAGLIVMVKRAWHSVGWLLTLIGLGLSTTDLAPEPPGLDERWHPWLVWTTTWGPYFAYTCVVALLVVFPDGTRGRTGRARRLGWIAIAIPTALTLMAAASDPLVSRSWTTATERAYPNPLGLSLVPQWFADMGFLLVFGVVLGSVFGLHRRRRNAGEEDRRRYTLVLYAFAVLGAALILGAALSEVSEAWWLPAYLAWLLIPVAFTVAIVRHGLFGVHRLVSRTVTYGLVALLVGTVWTLPVIGLSRVLGASSDLVVAASTLVAAAVFNPIRRRVGDVVDRRFNRSRYDADLELEAFAERLKSEVALDSITQDLFIVVGRTLGPQTARVWIRT